MQRMWISLVVTLSLAGCHVSRETDPARSATEQLLISTAADRCLDQLEWPLKAGTRCFLTADAFDGYDKAYVLSAVRERLLRSGVHVAATAEEADVLIEVRSGALSVDDDKVLIGIPSIQLPLPPFGSMTTPELALFAIDRRQGVAKFGYHARNRVGGAPVHCEPVQIAMSHRTEWTILLIGFTTQDLYAVEDE